MGDPEFATDREREIAQQALARAQAIADLRQQATTLADSVEGLTQSVEEQVAELKKDTTTKRWRSTVALVVLVAAVAVGGVAQNRQLNEQTDQLEQLARENRGLLRRLEDCLNPGGECYQRSQDSQRAAILTLVNNDRVLHGLAPCVALEECVTSRGP